MSTETATCPPSVEDVKLCPASPPPVMGSPPSSAETATDARPRPITKIAIVAGAEEGEKIFEPPRARHYTIDGNEATMHFLRSYVKHERNSQVAKDTMEPDNTPSLAGVYLKQFLKRERNLQCEVLHRFVPSKPKELEDLVRDASILLISTSMMISWEFPEKIAATARAMNPSLTIIGGGTGVYKKYHTKLLLDSGSSGLTDFEASVLRHHNKLFVHPKVESAYDFLVISHSGENTLLKLLDALAAGTDVWKTLPNLCWYDKVMQNFHINEVVDEIGTDVYVDWSQENLPPGILYPVQVSQGCPFRCGFCDFATIAPKIKQAPLDVIFDMLERVPLEDGRRNVYFTNENLLYNKKFTMEFLTEMIKRDLKIKWRSFLRIDSIQEPEVADLVKQAGCVSALLGVESADPTILANMHKHCTTEKIVRCISLLAERGITATVFLLFGYPGETEETVRRTIEVMNNLPDVGIIVLRLFNLCVLPMSPLSSPEERTRFGLKGLGNMWEHATMNSDTAYKVTQNSYDNLRMTLFASNIDERMVSHKLTDEQLRDFYLTRNILYHRQANVPMIGGDTYPPTEQLFEHLLHLVSVS
ncbi:radical SAM protein [Pelomyxa schiedti]|nr:radical SAM protein [Pelomyxa schiedti]